MGTSVQMIDATYGHLAHDAEDQDRGLLDAYDAAPRNGRGHACGHDFGATPSEHPRPENQKAPQLQGFPERAREDSNL